MQRSTGSRRERQAGKGIIAFLIAIIVVGFVGNTLWTVFKVKSRADEMDDFVYESLKQAVRSKQTVDEVRAAIVEKAVQLRLPIAEDAIEVTLEGERWRAHFAWDDKVVVPGYTHPLHFEVDKTWTQF